MKHSLKANCIKHQTPGKSIKTATNNMTSYFKNLVTMMQILTSWAVDPVRVAITNQVPIFKKGIIDVKSKATQASLLSQMLNLTGIAQDKKQLKGILCEIIVSITYPAKSYAIITGNNTLFQQVKSPISALANLSTLKLIETSQAIHDTILPLVDDMKTAGIVIDTEIMETLQQAINTFQAASNSPVVSIQNRKAVNQQVNKLVKEANAICHQILDENIISFKPIDLQYIADYKIKRQVAKEIRHNRLFATVVNELGEPQYNVSVTVDELVKDGKTYQSVSKTTDLAGNVIVREFESGYRTVTVSGANIKSKTFGPYKFQNGKEVKDRFEVAQEFVLPASKSETKELVKK